MTGTTRYPRYFEVSPRGFSNEITYYRIANEAEAAEAEAEYEFFEDKNPGAWAQWSNHKRASIPGVAIKWEDRHRR